MAKRSGISGAIYFVIILVVFSIFLLARRGSQTNPKHFNWWPNYDVSSTQPYGSAVLKHFLQNTFGADSLIIFEDGLDGLPKAEKDRGAYLFIGHNVYEEEQFIDSLFSFVEAGNEALILTESFTFELLDRLLLHECDWLGDYYEYLDRYDNELMYDSLGNVVIPSDSLQQFNIWEDYSVSAKRVYLSLAGAAGESMGNFELQRLFKNEPALYDFEFIHSELLCEDAGNFEVLGYLNDSLINFVRFDLGGGQLYLNTTPLAFTNHPLLHGETLPYATEVFARLSSKKIFWDQTSHYDTPNSPSRVAWREGPLHYVLSQPPLAIAWYLLLAMAILFLFFRAKRRQRVIPVLEANTNTSLEFIENIGRLYFMSEDYRHLLLLKMQMFLSYVRSQYRIPTNRLDEQFAKTLTLRSGVDAGIIDKILLIYKNVSNSDFVSQSTLVSFHQAMDKFYQESR